MLKPVIAATAALVIGGSTLVYAQQRFGGHDGSGQGGARAEHHHRMSADDINAFADARIAALKAGLELTPDQTKNWPAFEAALRNMVQLRVQRMQAHQAAQQAQTQTPTSPFDRMSRRADAMAKRGAALKQIADAGSPLYQSLTDTQKTRFTMLGRLLRPHQHQHANNGGNMREGHGYGRGGQGQDGHRFGQNGGQDGQGWQHGRRFGQNDQGGGHGHHFGQGGRGQMQNLMNGGGDEDSQL
jgi:zinc resistance-associated protein